MLSVRLGWQGTRDVALHATWRRVASLPPPELPGLLARQWQLDRTTLQAYYLFKDQECDVSSFLADPAADQAYANLASQVRMAAIESPHITRLTDSPKLDRPVFIIAAPRSGSTLLFDLLSQAPDLWTQGGEGQGAVEGIGALHPAQRGYISDRLTDADLTPEIEACLMAGWHFGLRDRQGRRHGELSEGERGRAPRLLDKTTEHTLRVAFLARACPDAHFVLLHRDARQNISSLMRAWLHGGFVRIHDLAGWPTRNWCFLLPPGWTALRYKSLQTLATAQWEAAYHWALHDLEMIDRARWTSVDYNELVVHPRRVVERLCKFLDIEMDSHLAGYLTRPLSVTATAISPPSVIKWRSHRDLAVPLLEAATRVTSARLRSLHLMSDETVGAQQLSTAAQIAVRFVCHLAEVPSDDVAERTIENAAPSDLLVEPTVRFQLGASIPLGLATTTRFRERFLADQPILWMRDMLTQAYRPFWVPRHQAQLFAAFEPGAPAPPCPPRLCAKLYKAGIITLKMERSAAEHHFVAVRALLAREFAEQGYCVIRNLLAPPHTAALARYYRQLIASGDWTLGDEQVARRHGWHNESVARFFHHQLMDFVRAVVGKAVCASYAYVSAYQQGAELGPHVDRKQCEYTISVIVDETGGHSAEWLLWFLAGDEPSAVSLSVGDGVLFRGHDLPHWREAAPQSGLALSTLLLHYVPANFNETLN